MCSWKFKDIFTRRSRREPIHTPLSIDAPTPVFDVRVQSSQPPGTSVKEVVAEASDTAPPVDVTRSHVSGLGDDAPVVRVATLVSTVKMYPDLYSSPPLPENTETSGEGGASSPIYEAAVAADKNETSSDETLTASEPATVVKKNAFECAKEAGAYAKKALADENAALASEKKAAADARKYAAEAKKYASRNDFANTRMALSNATKAAVIAKKASTCAKKASAHAKKAVGDAERASAAAKKATVDAKKASTGAKKATVGVEVAPEARQSVRAKVSANSTKAVFKMDLEGMGGEMWWTDSMGEERFSGAFTDLFASTAAERTEVSEPDSTNMDDCRPKSHRVAPPRRVRLPGVRNVSFADVGAVYEPVAADTHAAGINGTTGDTTDLSYPGRGGGGWLGMLRDLAWKETRCSNHRASIDLHESLAKCCVVGCVNGETGDRSAAVVGAHVWVYGKKRGVKDACYDMDNAYIVPTCSAHNGREFDYPKRSFVVAAGTPAMRIIPRSDYADYIQPL